MTQKQRVVFLEHPGAGLSKVRGNKKPPVSLKG